MLRTLMKSKIHGALVTEANLRYTGSITIDKNLMKASKLCPFERVQIVNLHNGTRVETYVLEGQAGSGMICMNGAAARWAEIGRITGSVQRLEHRHHTLREMLEAFIRFRDRYFRTEKDQPYLTKPFHQRWVQAVLTAIFTGMVLGLQSYHALVKFGAPGPSTSSVTELASLYVQEHFARRGIGSGLVRAAQNEALHHVGSSSVWLTVNARNANAIAFYRRLGFAYCGVTYFDLGDERHENHVLVSTDACPLHRASTP